MEHRYQTIHCTFIVVRGICKRVVSNSVVSKKERRKEERKEGEEISHPAVGCPLLGGIQEVYSSEMTSPPKEGQFLVFCLSLVSDRNRVFSDTRIQHISERLEAPSRRHQTTIPGV
jgi:hypothetical protein